MSGNNQPFLCYAIDRAAFNQGENAQYDIGINDKGIAQTLVEKGLGAVCGSLKHKWVVRRVVPFECARLQGMPDWWCKDVPHSNSAEYKMWGNGLGLFWLEAWFGEWVLEKLNNFYVNRRFLRGDHTLAVHLVNAVRSKLGHYLEKNKNTYGYSKLSVEAELGSLDGKTKDYEYYLQNKKIYSNRYSTDSYGDYFAVNALKSGVSILDYPEFENTKATLEEFMKENSYNRLS